MREFVRLRLRVRGFACVCVRALCTCVRVHARVFALRSICACVRARFLSSMRYLGDLADEALERLLADQELRGLCVYVRV